MKKPPKPRETPANPRRCRPFSARRRLALHLAALFLSLSSLLLLFLRCNRGCCCCCPVSSLSSRWLFAAATRVVLLATHHTAPLLLLQPYFSLPSVLRPPRLVSLLWLFCCCYLVRGGCRCLVHRCSTAAHRRLETPSVHVLHCLVLRCSM